MATRLTEIRQRQEQVRSDLAALEHIDNPSEDDHVRADALLQEFDELQTESEPLQERADRIAAVRSAAANSSNTERTTPDVVVRSNADPFADTMAIRSGHLSDSDYRARALTAVEQVAKRGIIPDEHAEEITRKIETLSYRSSRDLAQLLLETSSPEYRASFNEYLANPVGMAQRAALSLTPSANGGYMLPTILDPSIVLTNNGTSNPIRQYATVRTITGNYWNGVTSAGVNAEWTDEHVEVGDDTPTVGPIQVQAHKAAAWIEASFEFAEDSTFAAQLPGLLADAKDRLESTAFMVGDGNAKPYGMVTRIRVSGTQVSAAGSSVYTIDDAYALQQAIPARFRGPGARDVWLMSLANQNRTRKFDTSSGASNWATPGDGTPQRFLGWPFLESTELDSTITGGSNIAVAGDISQYVIVDRIGMSLLYEPLVKGANRRPVGDAGWYAFWRVGGDLVVPNAMRLLIGHA